MASGLLDFRKSGDQDGFVGDFSAKTKMTTEIYQLKVRTAPGEALFEVSVVHDLAKNIFHTKVSPLFIFTCNIPLINMQMYFISPNAWSKLRCRSPTLAELICTDPRRDAWRTRCFTCASTATANDRVLGNTFTYHMHCTCAMMYIGIIFTSQHRRGCDF